MRTLILALALVVAPLPQASAQETPTEEAAPTPTLAAARDLVRALLIDSGLMRMAIDTVWAQYAPQVREQALQMPDVSDRGRRAVIAFLETAPTIVQEEVDRLSPQIIASAAPEIADVFTDQELNDIAQFMRDERTRTLFARIITNNMGGLTVDDLRYVRDFSSSPAGLALSRKGDQLSAAIERALDGASAQLTESLTQRIFDGVCAALADECPTALRTMAEPT